MSKKLSVAKQVEVALRERALRYPETREDFPWGESVVKVRGKVFIFLGMRGEDGLHLSVKLPHSNEMALMLPFARPTGYGLGKSGWVSAEFTAKDRPPLPMLLDWLDESYRAVAPAKLVKVLETAGEGPASAARAPARKPPARSKKASPTARKPPGKPKKRTTAAKGR